jgi:transposase InsO family protein
VHEANYGAYGYRKMHLALKRDGVEDLGRDRVRRLMRQHGICGAKRRGKPWLTTIPDPDAARRPDLVRRDFSARRPDELYVADFTYLRCWEGLVFLAFVIDVFSRRIVGWELAPHMRASLVCDALAMAVGTRPRGADVVLTHHSDRGSQYLSWSFTQILDDHHVLQSVGSVGDALDNALAESFVDTIKTELIADRVWRTAPTSRSPSWNGSAGSTTPDSTSPSATSRPPSSKPSTHSVGPRKSPAPAPRNTNETNDHGVREPSPPQWVSGVRGGVRGPLVIPSSAPGFVYAVGRASELVGATVCN